MPAALFGHDSMMLFKHPSDRQIVLVTLFVGSIPFFLLTWYQGTLVLNGTVNGPLLAVPSVWVGDTFFLPIFNVYALRLLRIHSQKSAYGAGLARWWLLPGIVSAVLACSSHYMWTQDQFTGFIDPTFGKLSLVGWWHLAFTISEMTLVFAFVKAWLSRNILTDEYASYVGRVAWRILLPYSLLSVVDFMILHEYLLPRRGVPDYTASTAWQGILIIPFWGVIAWAAEYRRRAINHAADARGSG
jgi:hypothetical protein